MQSESKYIEPSLLLESSYRELLKLHEDYGPLISWVRDEKQIKLNDLLRQECTFVVGEPGQGKSRLVRELASFASQNGYKTVLFRLNQLGRNQPLEEALCASPEQSGFELSATANTLVCLDGLDEVASSKFSETILQIRKYIEDHPTHKLIITSRIHFFTKYEDSLSTINASYALLMPLDHEGQVTLLKQYKLTDTQITEAFLKLKQPYKEAILETPRYLEYFAEWYSENSLSRVTLSRSDIFNYFVDQALDVEDKKVDKKISSLRRRTLEKLALVMEIAQINSITHDEMITFIEEYKSEAKLILLSNTEDLDAIYNHGLLKDDGEKIAFDNAELQEYLAASAINRMDSAQRAAFQLAVDKEQRSISPSWYSSLSFLLEMRPELLTDILELEKPAPNSPERPEDPDTHKLISGVSSEIIPSEERSLIFKHVLDYYIENNIYIKYEISSRLAFYSTPFIDLLLIEYADRLEKSKSYANLANIAQVIAAMKRINRLADESKWKTKLLTWTLLDGEDEYLGVLKRQSMHALQGFRDDSIITTLKPLHEHRDDMVRKAYETMCEAINPNHPESVSAFVEGIKNGSIEARLSLLHVDTKNGLLAILGAMIEDSEFLKEIVSHDSVFKKDDNKFTVNLNQIMDGVLLKKCKQVVVASFEIDHGYYVDRSDFLDRVFDIISKNDENYFAELLAWALEREDRPRIYDVQLHLARMMKPSDVELWSNAIDKYPDMKNQIMRVVTTLDGSNSQFNTNSEEIVKESRKAQPDLFKQYDAELLKMSLRNQRDRDQEEFDKMIALARDKGDLSALSKALQMFNKEKKVDRFGKNVDKHLWSISKRVLIEPFDPAQAVLKIHRDEGNLAQSAFNVSNFIWAYTDVVQFAAKTGQDISSYRHKFIALLAFTFNDDTEACLNLLGILSAEESAILINTFKDLSADRARFQPSNFIQAAKRFRLVEAVEIIDAIADQDEFDIYVRREALELSESLRPNKARLQQLFEKHEDGSHEYSLKRMANGLLITKHNNRDAVMWLINRVKESASSFVEKMEMHSVGALEHELHSGEISRPLRELADDSYIGEYLGLLEFSFELFERGIEWNNYAYYIWKIVVDYFNQLKNNLQFGPLIKLEKWVADHHKLTGINFFKDKLVELRREYSLAISKPKNFNSAIKLAERVRAEDGIGISSVPQLKDVLEITIQEEIIPWIETDARKIMNETHAQKLIKVQLEASLLKSGFNPSQLQMCNIIREAQELDDTRTDFLVYHGFTGPVIIELKMFSNTDLKGLDLTKKKSYSSLQNYMRQYKTNQAIFMVLDNEINLDRLDLYEKRVNKISNAYTKLEGVSVMSARLPDRKPKSTPKPKKKAKT